MQCACAILSSVACPALKQFPTLSHKRRDFQRKKSLNTKYVFWFSVQLLSETFLILRIHGHTNAHSFPGKGPVILVIFFWKLNFLDRFPKNTPISNSVKIRPVHRQTERHDESNFLKYNFASVSKNQWVNPLQTKHGPLYLKTQSVPRCKHFSSRL